MRKHLSITVILILLSVSAKVFAQVKIGDNPTTVNPASVLELETTNKGLLLPRLTDTSSISNPPQGMFMFNNTDTSLYFRRKGGWRRLSIGGDNYWKGIGFDIGLPVDRIFTDYPAIIAPQGDRPKGTYAPLLTRGMYGNTLAMFGQGSDNTQGVSLTGNWPGVYFNSYYDGGVKSMAAGNTGNISLDESNNSGGAYSFKLTGNASASGASILNSNAQMILNNDGKFSLNTGSVPTRAWFEQHGSVNNTAAIFGGEGSGVAIEEHFPSIGFNSYYDGGSGYKSIGAGYGGEIGIDQNNGDFYVTNMKTYAAVPDASFVTGFVRTFNISRDGYVGINTMDPQSQIEIDQPNQSINSSNGLTFTSHEDDGGFHYTTSFNISGFTGVLNGDIFDGSGYLVFQSNEGSGYSQVANIDHQGAYHQTSDARFKKDIVSLDQNDMLQKLLLLRPSNYHFIDEKSNYPRSYGFLAQDVEKIFPEFVNEIQGKKMLAYSDFIPVIVSAVQEQQREIEALQKENKSLKEQIVQILSKLNSGH